MIRTFIFFFLKKLPHKNGHNSEILVYNQYAPKRAADLFINYFSRKQSFHLKMQII